MVAFRRFLVAGFATLLLAGACTSINFPTIPPININIPTIPPINFPGSSIPPLALPSGLLIPPGVLPSVDATTGVCAWVSTAEIASIFGGPDTVTSNDQTSCDYTLSNFATISVTTSTDSDLSSSQVLLGSTAKQTTIGGFPAVTGSFIGQAIVFVQKAPGQQLEVLGILTGADDATLAKLSQVAQLAVSRWQ